MAAALLVAGCSGPAAFPESSRLPPPTHLTLSDSWQTLPNAGPARAVKLTEARWRELVAVHAAVQRKITYVSDRAQYGKLDFWTLPVSGAGDCEDMALERMDRLLRLGWPRGALRMAVVDPPDLPRWHAVQTAETDRGVYVLDYLVSGPPLPWSDLSYRWIAREWPIKADVVWEVFTPGGPANLFPSPTITSGGSRDDPDVILE